MAVSARESVPTYKLMIYTTESLSISFEGYLKVYSSVSPASHTTSKVLGNLCFSQPYKLLMFVKMPCYCYYFCFFHVASTACIECGTFRSQDWPDCR